MVDLSEEQEQEQEQEPIWEQEQGGVDTERKRQKTSAPPFFYAQHSSGVVDLSDSPDISVKEDGANICFFSAKNPKVPVDCPITFDVEESSQATDVEEISICRRKCPICLEELSMYDQVTLPCFHQLCTDCFTGYCENKITSGYVRSEELSCPGEHCQN